MRWICLLIGYFCGSFLTADVVSYHYTGHSAATLGTSHNPGMANVMRTLGFKPGILVLFGDLCKCAIAMAIAHALFPTHDAILYAGLGTILGHDFPFWRHFHGGKGVACTCALLVMYQPLWGCIALVVGGLIVVLTKKLWLGGIVMPLLCIIPWMMQNLEAGLVGILVSGLSLYSFRKDIGKR